MTYIEKNERDELPTKEEIETEDSRGWRILNKLERIMEMRSQYFLNEKRMISYGITEEIIHDLKKLKETTK